MFILNEWAFRISKDDIRAGAVKLNTYAQRCSQEDLERFEPTIIWLMDGLLYH